jgi:hypothetical protein
MKTRAGMIASVLFGLVGCAAKRPPADYATLFEHWPRSIAVVPVLDRSGDESAGPAVASLLTVPLAQRGYYVFPVYVTDRLLRDLGLGDPALVRQTPPQRFFDLFGADAVLFVTVENSSTSYFVVGSSVSVTLDYELKDTRTGKSLWHRALTVAQGSDVIAPVGGGLVAPAAGLALTMADAALTATTADRRILAQAACEEVFEWSNEGLPPGPYSSESGRNRTASR